MRFWWLLLFYSPLLAQKTQLPQVAAGTLQRHTVASQFVAARLVDVWLPPGYSPLARYDVLYMHDGQMLFDAQTTWNKQSWQVDETLAGLMAQNKIRPVIVVGVHNNGSYRRSEYWPEQALPLLPPQVLVQTLAHFPDSLPRAEAYLNFLVNELKPFIDSTYAVHHTRNHTFIAGASMGGLISLYAATRYPGVFGGAACLSTHWVGFDNTMMAETADAFIRYFETRLPAKNRPRLYFDCGDQTLDRSYKPFQDRFDSMARGRGYTRKRYQSLFFAGQDHSEEAWAARFHLPVAFLLSR